MLSLALLATALLGGADDPREAYDVLAYRLDLRVDPAVKRLSGTAAVEAKVVRNELAELLLRMHSDLHVSEFIGRGITWTHEGDRLVCALSRQYERGELVRVAIEYAGTPLVEDDFTGFHWRETPDGKPWIATSCQGIGAHTWFPCKASFYPPEDKHDRLFVNLTVPEGLVGVSNGHLVAKTEPKEGLRTFRWRSDSGSGTYAITLNVAPYVQVDSEIPHLPGLDRPLRFSYWVLPSSDEKAKVQFAQVPELLNVYSTAFGAFPFPEEKFALVETPFWGMEHSTAVAYGSSFPAWCKENDAKDRWASRNRWFDYILVHETAHEWWGNSVTALDWGHFWIHEGFATYAEIVYVEMTQGREAADRFAKELMARVPADGVLYRGQGKTSEEAYSGVLYGKGASVLHTLRAYVANDGAWWKSLQAFQREFRGRNAVTEDFRAILERDTKRDFEDFFREGAYGAGEPDLRGTVTADGNTLTIHVENSTEGGRSFHVPLALEFELGEATTRFSRTLVPGTNDETFTFPSEILNLRVVDRGPMLGTYQLEVVDKELAR